MEILINSSSMVPSVGGLLLHLFTSSAHPILLKE
jgi:hypothetical protein